MTNANVSSESNNSVVVANSTPKEKKPFVQLVYAIAATQKKLLRNQIISEKGYLCVAYKCMSTSDSKTVIRVALAFHSPKIGYYHTPEQKFCKNKLRNRAVARLNGRLTKSGAFELTFPLHISQIKPHDVIEYINFQKTTTPRWFSNAYTNGLVTVSLKHDNLTNIELAKKLILDCVNAGTITTDKGFQIFGKICQAEVITPKVTLDDDLASSEDW